MKMYNPKKYSSFYMMFGFKSYVERRYDAVCE